jgi:23S rRNA (adenine-N6)-dimethyltransferase
VRVVHADFLALRLPEAPFRVVGALPFARTTDILRRLFDDPRSARGRADLVVQWEVARKRAAAPPASLLSTAWAPWWEFRLARRIAATEFRPVPRVDAGVLVATRRAPALLPEAMARAYAEFVRTRWPFER